MKVIKNDSYSTAIHLESLVANEFTVCRLCNVFVVRLCVFARILCVRVQAVDINDNVAIALPSRDGRPRHVERYQILLCRTCVRIIKRTSHPKSHPKKTNQRMVSYVQPLRHSMEHRKTQNTRVPPPQVKMKKVLYIIHYITVVRDCDCIFPAQPLERKLKGGLLCNRGRRRAEDGEGRSSERVWGALGLTCGNDFSLVLVVLGESALKVWGCVRAVIVPLYTIYY